MSEHDRLRGAGEYAHWQIDNYIGGVLIGSDSDATGTVTNCTSPTSWFDVSGFTLAAFTPKYDCRVFFTGYVVAWNGTGSEANIYATVRNGSTEVLPINSLVSLPTAYFGTLPLCGSYDLTANTTYTFKVSVKSSVNGNVTTYGQLTGFVLPR